MKEENEKNEYDALKEIALEPKAKKRLAWDVDNKGKAKQLLNMWYYAMIVSFLPILVTVAYIIITSSNEWRSQLLHIIGGSEIVYIAVSLTTISTNDISSFDNRKQRWIRANQLLVIFGSMVYTAMSIAELNGNNNNICFMAVFNIVFFIITFILGRASYLKD